MMDLEQTSLTTDEVIDLDLEVTENGARSHPRPDELP